MSEFFHMGGYAFYVWTSYALFVFLLVYLLLAPWLESKNFLRQLKQQKKRQQNQTHSGHNQNGSET